MEYDKDFEKAVEAFTEYMKPIYHTPIDLGINEFKRRVDTVFPGMRRSARNKLIRAYKNRAWMDYHSIARHRGNFPTHTCRGIKVSVDFDTSETEIIVNA